MQHAFAVLHKVFLLYIGIENFEIVFPVSAVLADARALVKIER